LRVSRAAIIGGQLPLNERNGMAKDTNKKSDGHCNEFGGVRRRTTLAFSERSGHVEDFLECSSASRCRLPLNSTARAERALKSRRSTRSFCGSSM